MGVYKVSINRDIRTQFVFNTGAFQIVALTKNVEVRKKRTEAAIKRCATREILFFPSTKRKVKDSYLITTGVAQKRNVCYLKKRQFEIHPLTPGSQNQDFICNESIRLYS